MRARLVLAILTTILEEIAIVIIANWALPMIGINIPLAGLIALMLAWVSFSIFIFRMGSRALRKEPIAGLPGMVGSRGKVVSPLDPEGHIKIKNEIWAAKSLEGRIDTGKEVTVAEQDALLLIVRTVIPDNKKG